MQTYTAYYQSPIGMVEITGTETAILSVLFVEKREKTVATLPEILRTCLLELDEYFCGERQFFTVKIQQPGTLFQQRVWERLTAIPYGITATYSEIGRQLGYVNSARAIGHANSKNRIWLLIPCHRVIGRNGKLTGYAGGVWRKQWLLAHEQQTLTKKAPPNGEAETQRLSIGGVS